MSNDSRFESSFRRVVPMVCALAALAHGATLAAQELSLDRDWWQWGGPSRDFVVDAPPLQVRWDEGQRPQEIFRRELSGGHSTISTGGEQIFVHHGARGQETLTVLDQEGVLLWERTFGVGYAAGNRSHDGSHAAPLVSTDRVVTVSIDATVRCWDRADGKLLWTRDLQRQDGVTLPQAGYAASPLRIGTTLWLPGLGEAAGGLSRRPKEGLGVLVLDLGTGETLTAAGSFPASHASGVLLEVQPGMPLVLFHGMEELIAFDPETRSQRWSFPLRTGAADNVSFTPIWDRTDRLVLLSHAYDRRGAQAIRIGPDGGAVERAWFNPRVKVEHGNGLLWNDLLLASDGSSPGFLVALEASSGKLQWKERLPKSTLVGVRGQVVLVLDADGTLHVARPDRTGSRISASLEVLDGISWTAPTLVGRNLYLRDRDTLVALRLP